MAMSNFKRRKVEVAEPNWSKLSRDVLQMVLERLSSTDFDRAKAVCSEWRSASRESVRQPNRNPWLILFPYERSYGNSCRLLNPGEQGSVYRSRNLGVEFTQSRCIASCGSWLLMYVQDRRELYILNPLTRERINLPPLESRKNDIVIPPEDRDLRWHELASGRERALTEEIQLETERVVLWVDERSKDYMVLRSHGEFCLFFSKKGDDFWRMFPYVKSGCLDLVYRGHKLYIYTLVYFVEIFDFSGDSLVAVTPRPYAYRPPPYLPGLCTKRIAVTTSGEVLLVRCYNKSSFNVYEMNHVTREWDEVVSLGGEALIFDLGITVPAKGIQGIKPDSIYFSGLDSGTNHIFIFNLATRKVEPFLCSTSKFFDARWFIPM